MSKYDKAFFLWHHQDGTLRGVIALHVDDFVYSGTSEWLSNVIGSIMKTFAISSSAQGCSRYLGLNLVQTREAI